MVPAAQCGRISYQRASGLAKRKLMNWWQPGSMSKIFLRRLAAYLKFKIRHGFSSKSMCGWSNSVGVQKQAFFKIYFLTVHWHSKKINVLGEKRSKQRVTAVMRKQ